MSPAAPPRTSGAVVVTGLAAISLGMVAALTAMRSWDVERGARGLAVELGAVEQASRAMRLSRLPGLERDAVAAALEAASIPMRPTQKTSPTIVEALATATAAASRVEFVRAHDGSIRALAATRDGDALATASDDRTVRIWNPRSMRAPVATVSASDADVIEIAFSEDGSKLLTMGRDGSRRMWDAHTGAPLGAPDATTTWHTRPLADQVAPFLSTGDAATASARPSPDRARVVVLSADGGASVWNANGTLREVLRGHAGATTDAIWLANGALATAGRDGTLAVWRLDEGGAESVLRVSQSPITSLTMSADGARALVTSQGGEVKVLSLDGALREIASLAGTFTSAALSLDGARVATGSADNAVKLWSAAGALERTLSGHTGAIASIAWSSDGGLLATASADGTARLWNTRDGSALATFRGEATPLRSIAISNDASLVVTGDERGRVDVWDVTARNRLRTLESPHRGPVTRLVFDLDNRRVWTGGNDGAARFWDARIGRSLATLGELHRDGHLAAITALRTAPDGTRTLTASEDGTARFWNTSSARLIAALRGHVGPIVDAALSPDATRVLTAGADGAARLFHSHTGDLMATFTGFDGAVTAVTFAPDGTRALAAGADGTVHVLPTHPERMIERACRLVDRATISVAAQRLCAHPTLPMR